MNEAQNHFGDVRRLCLVTLFAGTVQPWQRAGTVLEAVRCHSSVFGADSTSTSADLRAGASEEAQLGQTGAALAKDEGVSAAGSSVAAKDNAVSLGGVATKNTLGSDLSGGQAVQNENGVVLGGFNNKNVLGGVELGGSNSGTINIGDSEGVKVIADRFAETVEKISDAAPINPNAGGDVGDERERATDGDSKFIWWALGILASLLIVVGLRKKKA